MDLGPPKRRTVLAALLLDAGQPVSTNTLIDRVWDDSPPDKARLALYAHITRIRNALRNTGAPGTQLERRPNGYVLDVDTDLVDLHRFRRLVDRARDPVRDESRARLLREALGLWRGTPLAGLKGQWAGRVRESVAQQRLGAALTWAAAERSLGDPQSVIDQLAALLVDHPLAEPLVAELMRTLCLAGRDVEALALYATTRARLADELGVDPGPELQRLHEQLLRRDRVLRTTPPAPAAPAGPATHLAPRQLPADVTGFTGRTAELDELLAHTGRHAIASEVVVCAVDGMAGVGKTALAVHAAHRLADSYPDGQLFVDLRGHAPDSPPVDPAAAIEQMLRSFGVPGAHVPQTLDERSALLRTCLAGRRVLIVLDDAADDGQVRPLLPGTPGCVVLVTSRTRLAGLHVVPLSLDVLPFADSVALFTRSVGPHRLTEADTDVVQEIVDLCGRLPLAVGIAAARLCHRPMWTPQRLAELLRDERDRLDELEAGGRSVTRALHLSYQRLTADQQRTFRLLGLHACADTDLHAAAALTGNTLAHARRTLEHLVDVNLLVQHQPGRYTFHKLVHAYAVAVSAGHRDAETERRAALARLYDHHTRRTATTAVDALPSPRTDQRPGRPEQGAAATPDGDGPRAAVPDRTDHPLRHPARPPRHPRNARGTSVQVAGSPAAQGRQPGLAQAGDLRAQRDHRAGGCPSPQGG